MTSSGTYGGCWTAVWCIGGGMASGSPRATIPVSKLPWVAFRIYDDVPSGWYVFPPPRGTAPPTTVERTPALWSPESCDVSVRCAADGRAVVNDRGDAI